MANFKDLQDLSLAKIATSSGINNVNISQSPYMSSHTHTLSPQNAATHKTISGAVVIEGKNADLVIGTKSMKDWMESIEKRLCVLEPKKELLEKYEALQQAYEHYKTLEALLCEDNSNAK